MTIAGMVVQAVNTRENPYAIGASVAGLQQAARPRQPRSNIVQALRKQLITIALCDIPTGNPVVLYEFVVQNAVCVTFHPLSYRFDPFFILRWE
jgi:hypothetical protein